MATSGSVRLPFATSHAFIIGINAYQNGISPLISAVRDGQDIAKLLEETHGYQVHLCLNATRDQFLEMFAKMKEVVRENDRVIFYFAGHGIALDSEEDPEGYLVPADARPDEEDTLVPMDLLHETLDALDCKHGLLILDCCFAGAFKWSTGFRDVVFSFEEVMYEERFYRFVAHPAWQVITSAAHDQKAADILNHQSLGMREGGEARDDGRNSPFARALKQAINLEGRADVLRGRRSDGVITASELYLYLRDIVESQVHQSGRRQSPSIFNLQKHGKGEFIFLHPSHSLNLPKAPETNPYQGLNPYTFNEASLFFGREEAVMEMAEKLKHTPILVVSAPSGQGKSSAVQAGLFPHLKTHSGFDRFQVIRPGADPVAALDKLEAATSPAPHLILIDQYEEFFTDAEYGEGHASFEERMKALLQQATQGNLKIVLTIRADFEWQLKASAFGQSFWEDQEIRRFLYRLPPMGLDALRQMMTRPLWAVAYDFESEEMVDQVLEEINHAPGAMPLLSFTLHQLFRYRDKEKRLLTGKAYSEQLNGINGALSTHADAVYQELSSDSHRKVMGMLMLRMVRLNDGSYSRRRTYLNQAIRHQKDKYLNELNFPDHLDQTVYEVLEALSDHQLIVRGRDDIGPYVEPMHDSLINFWPRCLGWIQELGREKLILQRQLWEAVLDGRTLWDSNPKLLQVIESLVQTINLKEAARVQMEILTLADQLSGEDRKVFDRLVTEWKASGHLSGLDAFVLTGVSHRMLDIFLEKGDHWLNEAEVRFIRDSWEVHTRDILNLKQERDEARSFALAARARQLVQRDPTLAVNLAYAARVTHSNQETITALTEILYDPSILFCSHWLRGHTDEVLSVAFSPDGKRVASGSVDQTVRIWSLETGAEIRRLEGHTDKVECVIFSPDGTKVLSASKDETIRLWSVETGVELNVCGQDQEFNNGFMSLAFSPDGRLMAAGSWDHNARIWETDSGRLLHLLEGHRHGIPFIRFHPDGTHLITCSIDNYTHYWSLETGERTQFMETPDFKLRDAELSPDGNMMLVGGESSNVALWMLETGEEVARLQGHTEHVLTVGYTPGGFFAYSGSADQTVRLWDLEAKREECVFRGHDRNVNAVIASQDGRFLASGSSDSSIRVWPIHQSRRIRVIEAHEQGIQEIALTPDGSHLITGSNDTTIALWSLPGMSEVWRMEGHTDVVRAVAISPDGKLVASGSWDNTVRLWEMATGLELGPLTGHTDWVNAVAFSPDGQYVLSGSRDRSLRLWSVEYGEESARMDGHTERILFATFTPDGQYIVSHAQDNPVHVWSAESGELVRRIDGPGDGALPVALSPDGKHVVAGTYDRPLIIRSLETGEEVNRIDRYIEAVVQIVYSPDGNYLLTCGMDQRLSLWSIQSGEEMRIPYKLSDYVRTIKFSPDGSLIYCGIENGNIEIFSNPLLNPGWDPEIYKINEKEKQRYGIRIDF